MEKNPNAASSSTSSRPPIAMGHRVAGVAYAEAVHSSNLAAITHAGSVRPRNEDAFHVSADGRFFVVADGMGGHQAGDVAAAIAVQTMADAYLRARGSAHSPADGSPERWIGDALVLAHEAILRAAEADEHRSVGMGATLSAACVTDRWASVCHAGDARAYHGASTTLRAVTTDHSLVASMVMAGEITWEMARTHPKRNVVLQALGVALEPHPQVRRVAMDDGTHLLLCTDGLWESLRPATLREVLGCGRTAIDCLRALVDHALEAGGADNMTAILYRHP